MSLVEILISMAVLIVTSVGGVSGFVMLNQYAANARNLSVAHALCQERIEQALTMTYLPASHSMPSAPSAVPNASPCTILGIATGGATDNYSSTGTYTGGSNLQTSSETIPIYTQSEGTATSNSAAVVYTRQTSVSPAALTSIPPSGGVATPLSTVQFTVTVTYVFRGKTYSQTMSTLRSQD